MNWISVDERMPDLFQWVIVCDSPKGAGEPRCINIYRWNGLEWERINDDDDDSPTFSDLIYIMPKELVTYWMPLPKAPINPNL